MLTLKSLQFQNIGRFIDKQIIDISALSDFSQVDGQNNNTKGSSGSGKTTVFNALDYLLGLNDIAATILQSRFTDEPICVVGQFDWDGVPVELTRSPSKLKIDINGDVKTGSSAVEEKINLMLGMSRDLFRKILHKRQKEGGFFLNLGPAKTHEFLMDCMKLNEYNDKSDKVDADITKITKEKSALELKIASDKSSLSATQDAILSLGIAPVKEVTKEMILELKEKADRSGIRYKTVSDEADGAQRLLEQERPSLDVSVYNTTYRDDIERRRKEIEAKIRKISEDDRERQERVRAQIHNETLQRSQCDTQIERGNRAKTDAAKIASEVKQIRSSTCPTCAQEWSTQSAKDTEQSKMLDLSKIKQLIIAGTLAEEERAKINYRIDQLKPQLHPVIDLRVDDLEIEVANIVKQIAEEKTKAALFLKQQNDANNSLLVVFQKKQADLRRNWALELDQVRGQADIDRRALDAAVVQLKSYEEAKARYESTRDSLRLKVENFTNLIENNTKTIVSLETKLLLANEALKAIKTFISCSFDDALEEIGKKATEIIRCIPNMSNATIQFDGTKEAKNGAIKEEVNAVISMDGEVGIPIKSLSGGERSALDLAIDLAVIDFIESKTGKGMNIFILDEPFNGLGTVEIEMALEVLKNSNTNKKLIIVDHNPEVKQMVQSRLLVVRDGTTSKVA